MIRPFDQTIDSKDELQELVLASQIYQHLDLEHQDITEKQLRQNWAGAVDTHLMDRKICYLIEVEAESINGFVRVERNRKNNSVFIDDLYIRADMRHQGMGSRLVTAAIEWARKTKAGTIQLSVHHTNEAGRNLYEKNGFKPTEPEYIDMEVKL